MIGAYQIAVDFDRLEGAYLDQEDETMKKGAQDKAVGYIRVSTDEQTNGPEAQRVEMERWCKAQGVELAAVFEEIGVSGAASLDKRLVLMEAIDALEVQGAGVLLVAKRDRLARDVVAAAMIERLVERSGAQVMMANGAGNGAGPESDLMRTLLDAFAQYERALIRARTRAALKVKRTRREFTGGEAPYGWTLAEDGAHLAPHQGEQAIIQAAQELKAQGWSLRKIGAGLVVRGMLPRAGGEWHAKSVRSLLVAEVAA